MDGKSLLSDGLQRVLFLVIALVLTGVGLWASSWSFSKIHHMRQLERVPPTPVSAVISGEVNLSGQVRPAGELLESPDTRTRAVYYRYVVEEERTDSDGDSYWATVKDVSRSVDFLLKDQSGEVLIQPGGPVEMDVRQDSQRVAGDMRYTEYLLEPGSKVFVFGYATREAAGYSVRFDAEGSFVPIVSENSEKGERQEMALWSALGLLGGLAGLSFAMVFLLGVFRVHHSAVYLLSVASVMVIVLLFQGVSMMKADVEDANTRAQRLLEEGKGVIERTLAENDIAWSGKWADLGSFADAKYRPLGPKERARLARVRLALAQSVERTNENLDRFPESLLGPLWGVSHLEALPLSEGDQQKLAALEEGHEPTRVGLIPALIGLALGALGSLFATWQGIKKVSTKRTIENVPTSPIEGVAYGLAEIKGTAELANGEPTLRAPISNRECVYYRHIIKRKDSDDDGWTTVKDEERSVSFFCRDATGRMYVDRVGARFIPEEVRTSRSGNRKHIEYRISPGEDLYVLGSAEIDPQTHDRLQIADGHGELPFIVSSYPEKTVMYKEARSAFYLLNVGLLATILAALGLTGTLGSFGPMLYTSAAGFACAYLFVTLFFLYYNDLIFLRERVHRNWSNIDVALKKRFDLITALTNTVKGYLAHESELQEALAQARATREGIKEASPDDGALAAEQHVRSQVLATIEAYPELKGQEMVDRLMTSLTDVENEIALMRDGYNDAVERFNTRQQKFPEVVIAKMFGFKRASHFRTFGTEREAPQMANKLAN
ncbi:hypothetical protein FIV42_23680 [Persicimonas caeni]|uniref:RING-type E3 ubiquitin transferase n=1 Tax=Persicimonas caeni TaxID=2292766 RepID=A0A4Y6Q0W3_PERCE|nr:LemA family protein [Persicimonas caeni]QDG53635.1 hypothetical protein FIV42_23680 [Persicimonas caeni]QED34856.1 hypothetical protein FRD00_23675 [Persicimonas caeni]